MNYTPPPAEAPIRTAVLGFGLSGRVFHAPFLAADDSFELSVIVTGDAGRQAEARRLHPGARVVDSAGQVFAAVAEGSLDLDLVVIGTPPATHRDLAVRAIEAGLAVVVDKPFAVSSTEGEEVVALAAERGVPLTVFQNRRWDADFLTLQAIIGDSELGDGSLGDVFRFESRFEWFKPEGARSWKAEATTAEGGGILFDLGTHLLDQALRLFGPVDRVTAELATRHPRSSAEDDAFVALQHRSGVTSHLWMNSLAAQKGARFHVLGRESAYTKWGLDGQEAALKGGALPTDEGFGVEPREAWGVLGVDGQQGGLVPVEPARGDYGGFYRQLAAALVSGEPLPVDPRDALDVLRLIEEIRRSEELQRTA
ncbi:oxidoreductase [Subtercola sp. Z020]|uniref:Gfo/Idh/MocA family protein n=1 Tax=Subtercola sp. Z020 TaxID=2080582 RepID=UPI000CE92393|nr:Gfo/Idh/MocA family oxidoreductase [Subtercola sp. Z020]PPF80162.1 oxidoreductase [Subtercola sp. Z020]